MGTIGNLAVGSKVKFGKYQVNTETAQDIIWTIVAKNHSGYPSNSVTLHAAEILDLRCFDAKEPDNSDSDRQSYGNNRYSVSNIDQWLNKDAAGDAWYSAAHSADHSPDTADGTGGYSTQYASRPGFLNGFTDDEKAAILSTTIRVVKPSVDGGSYEDVVRKVFLPSTTEVGHSNENRIAEGAVWDYYTSNAARIGYVTQQCFSNTPSSSKPSSKTTAWYWWLRTPYYSSANGARYVYLNGDLTYNTAYYGNRGVRPALNLSSSLTVSDSTDSDGCYTVEFDTQTSIQPPSNMSISGSFVQGNTVTISWDASPSDQNDGSISYRLVYYSAESADAELSTSWKQIYYGFNKTCSFTIPSNVAKIRFAADAMNTSSGLFSEKIYSQTYEVSAPATNSAPTVPSSITVPSTIYSGSNAVISWGASTDPDGDTVTYSLECAYDSGAYSVIYSGAALTYTHAVSTGKSTVTYRVRATDGSLYSDYKTANVVTISTVPVTRPKYPASSAALAKFAADAMQIAKITFSGVDETLTITNNDIVEHGLTIDRTVCSGNSIEIGSCIASEMQLILDNHSGKWNNVKFEGAEMYVQVGVKLDDGTTEYCPFGCFTVDEVPRKLKTITLTALDRMVMFDKPFDSTKIAFPCTVAYLVDRLCTICGVTLRSTLSGMPNASYSVLDAPVGDDITYRQMLSWCLEIMGACAFIDWTGQLVVGWYETTSTMLTTANRYSSDIFENAISITGVDITYDDVVYSAGEDGYKLNIVGNGLIQSKPDGIAANIYSTVSKLSYKPFSAVTKPYIDIYPMDVFSFKDASSNVSTVAVTATNFCLNGNLSVKGTGETSQRRGYAASNPLTARERVIIEDVARRAANDVTREESAALQLNETIANSFGLHRIEVKEADGSTTYYFADKSALADASIIYTFRANGFAWTTSWNNGNPVWQYGITKDGNALLKTLSVYKLTADYIDAGTLTVQKVLSKHGNTTISIDPTTGMQISTGSVKLFSVNTDSVDVKLSANSISLEAVGTGGTTSTTTEDVGLVTHSSDDTYYFVKPSGSDYYVSNNNGVANSYAYATVYFSFDEATTVNLSCISYGESNFDYGIISTVDAELAHSNTADTSNVLKSFKGESSSSAVNVSVALPSGEHFITIKYIKDNSSDSGNDTLQFRATVTKTVTTGNNGAKLTLKSGGTVLNSANISFTGFVTFNDLAQTGKTTINGGNITTGTISADRIDTSTLTVEQVQFKGDKTKTILTSNVKSSYAQTYLGIERSLSASGDEMYLQAADIMFGANPSDATLRFDLSTASEAIIRANSSSDTLQIGTNARRAKVYAGELYADYLTLGASETARLYVEGNRIFFEAANGNVYRIDTTLQS
jgi:hypothetical protein